jgi:serine protease
MSAKEHLAGPFPRPTPPRARERVRATRSARILISPVACVIALALPLALSTSLLSQAHAELAQVETATAPQSREYAPGKVLVKYAQSATPAEQRAVDEDAGVGRPAAIAPCTRLLALTAGETVQAAITRLRRSRDVVWATPDYAAHAAGSWIPNDPGPPKPGDLPGDWQQLQWNFAGQFGVNAPEAWKNLGSDGHPGGRGVIVAVLDTGVAYADRGRFRRSPDFGRYEFVKGYDFVDHTPYPNDRNGHGTFVAGTIAEATNNGFGLTGLAYGARIMPVRVLNGEGEGYASTIAEGIRFAVTHGARVINLSLEFASGVHASDIPGLIDALRFAYRRGVVVVAAAGNEGHEAIAYPAHGPHVIAVGATTEHGCLANYSNYGPGLTLVAPGGGTDASLPDDPNCRPEQPAGRDISQMTFTASSPRSFGYPGGYEGTSMAAPHVAAAAALVIASGVLGPKPTPSQIVARLRATARKLGGPDDSALYGAGLLNAAAATART